MGAMIFGGLAVDCYFTLSEFEDFRAKNICNILCNICILNYDTDKQSSGLLNREYWPIIKGKILILLEVAYLNCRNFEFSPPIIINYLI